MRAKRIRIVLVFLMLLSLVACGKNDVAVENTIEPEITTEEQEVITQETEEPVVVEEEPTEHESEPDWVYFEYNNVVDDFFKVYNNTSSNLFTVEQISKGNTRAKALAYNDTLSMEVNHVDNFGDPYIAVSISAKYEDEGTILYRAFVDVIQTVYTDYDEQEIERVWNELHSSGYMVSDYDFDGIIITYVPHRDTQEFSKPRLDMNFPIE